jgi:hypothetical protein
MIDRVGDADGDETEWNDDRGRKPHRHERLSFQSAEILADRKDVTDASSSSRRWPRRTSSELLEDNMASARARVGVVKPDRESKFLNSNTVFSTLRNSSPTRRCSLSSACVSIPTSTKKKLIRARCLLMAEYRRHPFEAWALLDV